MAVVADVYKNNSWQEKAIENKERRDDRRKRINRLSEEKFENQN